MYLVDVSENKLMKGCCVLWTRDAAQAFEIVTWGVLRTVWRRHQSHTTTAFP